MCGIAGIVSLDESPIDQRLLRRMIGEIRHRGPDAQGAHVEHLAALAHARLAVSDPEGGRQPAANEDGSLWITFDGEIFNHLELRRELLGKGHRFVNHSDPEVVLHGYEEDRDECVRRFNGQWAFALWDGRRQRLLLSRDRFGVRPLYYAFSRGKLLFASEIKALLACPEVPRRIDPRGLDQWFTFQTTLAPTTIFEGIYELPPGHHLVIERGLIRANRYWHLDYSEPFEPLAAEQWAERLRETLADAVRIRGRCDVPVGVCLDGRPESAVIAALMGQARDDPPPAFSVDPGGPQIGEVFPEVLWHTERPLFDTAAAPRYLLAALAREHGSRVVLSGDGAEELLGGCELFREAKVRRFWAARPGSPLRRALLARLYPDLPNLLAESPAYREASLHVRPEELDDPFFSHLPRWDLTSRLKVFFSPELRAELGDQDPLTDCEVRLPEGFAAWHPFCQAQWLEASLRMPGCVLAAEGDRVAMAHAVQCRLPFLDHRLVELAARIPPRLKMRGLEDKFLFKQAARGLVPEALLQRSPPRQVPPEGNCFFDPAGRARFPYVEAMLSPEAIRSYGLFQPEAVDRLVQRFRDGQATSRKDQMALIGILSTQIVAEQFTGRVTAGRVPQEEESSVECPELSVQS